jgi:hypothetical protein
VGFALDLTDEAAEDLRILLDGLPSSRRRDATDRVEEALLRLAENPRLAQREYLGRPSYFFHFKAEGVHYHWGCTFVFTEDEEAIRVTHIFGQDL